MANEEQWPRIKEIVGAALEREPNERSAFLNEACSEDQRLWAEVTSLLAAYLRRAALRLASRMPSELTAKVEINCSRSSP